MTREQLFEQIIRKQSFLCVGLDTDIRKIPQHLLSEEDPIFSFNKAIIDATAAYCVAYKPNLAFYESMGVRGWISFEKTIQYLNEHYPEQMIIADAKRGDIGNTSAMYARTFFEEINVDAVTVAPYMGEDSVTPFLGYEGKWVILLALTSNKGSHDFQLTEDTNGEKLFEVVVDGEGESGLTDRSILNIAEIYDFAESVDVEDVIRIDHGETGHTVHQQMSVDVIFVIVRDKDVFQIFGVELVLMLLVKSVRTEVDAHMVIEFVCRTFADILTAVFPRLLTDAAIAEHCRNTFRRRTAQNFYSCHNKTSVFIVAIMDFHVI